MTIFYEHQHIYSCDYYGNKHFSILAVLYSSNVYDTTDPQQKYHASFVLDGKLKSLSLANIPSQVEFNSVTYLAHS